MSHVSTITAARRWLPVALALALAACSGKEESAAPAPAAAPTAEELERQREQALDGLRVAYQQPGSVAGFAAAPVIWCASSMM